MLIEKLFPAAIEAISDLPARLRAEGVARGLSEAQCDALVSHLPLQLAQAECFLDRRTGLWKYEFGEPGHVGTKLIWGHLWTPVPVLFDVIACAKQRLPAKKLAAYMARLASDPGKHLEHLAEMFPLLRVDPLISAEHEVSGRGDGNRTIDWEIGPRGNRMVLLDVKRRFRDFFALMGAALPTDTEPEPHHDHALLFRSVEGKFREADPDQVLQGVWISTDIKQEEAELAAAYQNLDGKKVHFAMLGDARPDIHLITRRKTDRAFLLDLFDAVEGERFTFNRGSKPAQ